MKRWAIAYSRCLKCKSTARAHQGRGFCTSCYDVLKTKGRLPERVKFWGYGLDCCKRCGRSNVKHKSRGFCSACHKAVKPGDEDQYTPKVRVKPYMKPGDPVVVPHYNLKGTLVSSPYKFFGQTVVDVVNQWGERVKVHRALVMKVQHDNP